jgi:hypothetical protein
MSKKTGFIQEVTYGTSPLATPASDTVTYWGKMNYGWEHPWQEEPNVAIHQSDKIMATELVRGENKLEIDLKYNPVHAYPFIYAGFNTITSGGAGIYILEPSHTVALRSRTGYFEHDADIVEAQGLITQDLNMTVEMGKPTIFEEKMVGTSCKNGTIITTATNPIWPASIASTDIVGWQNVALCQLDDVDLSPTRVFIGIHNVLQGQSGMMKSAAINYNNLSRKRSIMAITFAASGSFNGTANDFWALYKAATRDKKFELNFSWSGTTYYWQITLYNCRFNKPKVTIPAPDDEGLDTQYTMSGSCWLDLDSPTELPKVVVKDGATYT